MIEGGQKHSGISQDVMELFWKQLEDFAAYCFNKSHAACYALVSYWTAYLKAYYPAAFMASLMTSDYDNIDRLAIEISACKQSKIEVLPPDVNESYHEFAVVPNDDPKKMQIRFGLDAIKNVGYGAAEEIIRARTEGGAFKSMADFITRVNGRLVNKKVWESLAKSGALNRFGDRGAIVENLESILAIAAKLNKEQKIGQTDLFGNETESNSTPIFTIEVPPSKGLFTEQQYLQWERELMGLYISSHPLEPFEAILTEQAVPLSEISPDNDGKTAVIGGTVKEFRQITTKNGQPMAFAKLEDLLGDERELIIFPGVFKDTEGFWNKEKILLIKGRVDGSDKNGALLKEAKFLVSSVSDISIETARAYKSKGRTKKMSGTKKFTAKPKPEQAGDRAAKRLYIRLPDTKDQVLLEKLKNILDANHGSVEAVLVLGSDKKQIIKLPKKIDANDELLLSLKKLVGKEDIKYQ
jgi:DNA polymerase-3 subunit alpha